jgi:tetratricopeptide (TPR) repeat protein
MRARHFHSFLFVVAVLLLSSGPAWPGSLVDDTREALRLGKYDHALKLLDAALDENAVDVNAHLLMTEYYLAIQDYPSAELSTERTLVLNRDYAPLIAQGYYNAAERAMGRRQAGYALALYEMAGALDPAFRGRMKGKYMAVGRDLLAQRRFATALNAYNQELTLNPGAKKSIADAVFVHGQSLLGNNDKAAEKLFSYAVSLDSSWGQRVAGVRLDHGLSLLRRAQAATGEERRKLKEQSLRYVSREMADQAVPPPVWTTVFREEYAGRGLNDEDGVIMTPRFGEEVRQGDRIVVIGKEFQLFEDGWKTHTGTYETIGKSPMNDSRVGIRARRGEMITLEVQRSVEQ